VDETTWAHLEAVIRAEARVVVAASKPELDDATLEAETEAVVERLRGRAADLISKLVDAQDLVDFRAFVRLYAEYCAIGIGELFGARILRVAALLKKYKKIDEPELLVSRLTENLLKNDRRALHALMDRASSLKQFDNLLAGRFGFRETRDPEPLARLDRLLRRSRDFLKRPPFVEVERLPRRRGSGGQPAYSVGGEKARWCPPRPEQLADAARRVSEVPRIPTSASAQRSSPGYTTPDLVRVLSLIGDSLPGAFTIEEVRDVLDLVLGGAWKRRKLVALGTSDAEGAESSRVTDAEVVGDEAAREVLGRLQAEVRAVLAVDLLKVTRRDSGDLLEFPITDVARVTGLSTPTVRKRLAAAHAILTDAERELPYAAWLHALKGFVPELRYEGIELACRWVLENGAFASREVDGERLYGSVEPVERAELTESALDAVARSVALLEDRGRGGLGWFERAIEHALASAGPSSVADVSEIIERALTLRETGTLDRNDESSPEESDADDDDEL
jgi:hypothetical protein